MADSPNSTILSRRALMASAPAVALAALPVAALAAPVPAASPRERMDALIKELQLVVQELYPNIDSWLVANDKDATPINGARCPFTIAAFDHPGTEPRPVPKRSPCTGRVQS